MPQKATTTPQGYHTITPTLTVRDAEKALEFYGRAFGAEETVRMPGPGGKVLHAELRIGDSVFMLSEEFPEMGNKSPEALGGTSCSLYVYVQDVDAAYKRAVDAGAKASLPPEDMFWGDRIGKLEDPSGHVWTLAQHVSDPTPEQMEQGQEEFFSRFQNA